MNCEEIDVKMLLPQKAPFVLIDRLRHLDQSGATTTLLVREDNIFTDDGSLNPCAYVENIAQTCAARLGYINKYIYHREVCIGFIGAIRNLSVRRAARVGELITTCIKVREEVMQLMLVEATVCVGSETVCTAEMKIAVRG